MREMQTAAVLFCLAASAVGQIVEARVKSIGFPSDTPTGLTVRGGYWMPVLLELRQPGSEAIQCRVEVESIDSDGDRVRYTSELFGLPGSGATRRVWTYAALSPVRAARMGVVDQDGAILANVDVPPCDFAPPEAMLVLDLSESPLTALHRLQRTGSPDAPSAFYRPLRFGLLAADEFPDRALGLEAVDVIVWDRPDPGDLPPGGLQALLDWVDAGGQLVLGLGAAWPQVAPHAELVDMLPVQPVGQTVLLGDLQLWRRNVGGEELAAPIPVALTQPRPGALVGRYERDVKGLSFSMISMAMRGAGRVTAVAASLQDLLRITPASDVAAEIIDLNRTEPAAANRTAMLMNAEPRELQAALFETIDFREARDVRQFLAVGFVLVYILIAAFLSWMYVQRRGRTRWAWPAFGVCAVAGSALSLGLVTAARGLGRVQAVGFIDLIAGEADARVHSFLGYRAVQPGRPAFSLSEGDGWLRPIVWRPGHNQFAAPEQYRASPTEARIFNVPVRSTLKQLEGWWKGEIRGSIRAQLVVDIETGRLTANSWVQNDLDAPIAGGFILYVDPRVGHEPPLRAAGLTASAVREGPVPPAMNVLAVEIAPREGGDPALRPGDQLRRLGQLEYDAFDRGLALRSSNATGEPPTLKTLYDRHRVWDPVRELWQTRPDTWVREDLAAALLISTHGLYTAQQLERAALADITTAGVSVRDVTHWLVRGQAVMLLAVRDAPPTPLERDGVAVRPSSGLTLYRVLAPLQYESGAANP